jgi:hypothetical protein
MALPAKAVTIVGALRFYETTADSGNKVSSGFCAICGSPILKKSSGYPEMVFVHAATLDDPSGFSPQSAVWGASRQPWDYLDPALA